MSLALIIYIIGIIASFIMFLISADSDITVQDLLLMIITSSLSWAMFLLIVLIHYKDIVIFKINKNNNLKMR